MSDDYRYATGRVIEITEIKCPKCHREFDEGGNADGRLVICPSCGLSLTVRKDDGA